MTGIEKIKQEFDEKFKVLRNREHNDKRYDVFKFLGKAILKVSCDGCFALKSRRPE